MSDLPNTPLNEQPSKMGDTPKPKHVQPDMDRQFACFLFGVMALDGCLTPEQTEESDKIEWMIGALTKGMAAAVPGWTFGKIASLQEMYNIADSGETEYRKRRPKSEGGAE